MDTWSLFITIAGFIIGLGAVTVIDLHGLFALRSPYWTEATIRSHKITKPLIWIGIMLVLIGQIIAVYAGLLGALQIMIRFLLILALIINGCFLSFIISPQLLRREREGLQRELLPAAMKKKIALSFIVSVIGWWGLVYMVVAHIAYV